MTRIRSSAQMMLVSDLDETMAGHALDPQNEALLEFNQLWEGCFAQNSTLVYATGRSWELYLQLKREVPLLTPQVLILSVGTEIRFGPTFDVDTEWHQELSKCAWDTDIIRHEAASIPNLLPLDEKEQGHYKVTFKAERGINTEEIEAKLSERLSSTKVDFRIVLSGRYVDVLPSRAGKGPALEYALGKLEQQGKLHQNHKNVLVCGDSGNDIDMFKVDGVHGVIVSNAKEELVKWHENHNLNKNVIKSDKKCASAILDALKIFGFSKN